jgi:hypothetical protein
MTTYRLRDGRESTAETNIANIPQKMANIQYSVSLTNEPLSQTFKESPPLLL